MNNARMAMFLREDLKTCKTDVEREVVNFMIKTSGIFIGNLYGIITISERKKRYKFRGPYKKRKTGINGQRYCL